MAHPDPLNPSPLIIGGITVARLLTGSPLASGQPLSKTGPYRVTGVKGGTKSGHSQKELDHIADQLNTRPRKTLDFKTPANKLETLLR